MTRTVSARINNEIHEKLVNVCNESGKTVNEMLNVWIKEQSELMTECISKSKIPEHIGKIDRTNLENWVSDMNRIKVENV